MCLCCCVFTSLSPRGVCVIYTHKLYAGACVLRAAVVIDIGSVPGIGISTALAPCLPHSLSLSLYVCLWQFQRIRRLSAQGHDSVTPACQLSPLLPSLLLFLSPSRTFPPPSPAPPLPPTVHRLCIQIKVCPRRMVCFM